MSKAATISQLGLICLIITVALLKAPHVGAFFLADWLNSAKDTITNIVSPQNKLPKDVLIVDSKIELASDGDINKNNTIDSGDTVKFSYVISNTTKDALSSVTLKTNLDSKNLNGISNVVGVLSIIQKDNTIFIPNITVKSNQMRTFSFNSQINFSKDQDLKISTEPEILNSSNISLTKSPKNETTAKKMDEESFNKFVQVTK